MGSSSATRTRRSLLLASLSIGFAILLSYLPYRLIAQPSQQKLHDMQAELARVQTAIAQRTAEVRERRLQVEALKTDPQTIEIVAREELQMLYPHEKSLRFSTHGETP